MVGGSAMYSGANFQATFGAWCAVLALAEEAEQLPDVAVARIIRIGAEQNWPLDDNAIWFENDARAFCQAKERITASDEETSELSSVANQMVRQFLFGRGRDEGAIPLEDNDRFVIVVPSTASRAIWVDLKEALDRLATHPQEEPINTAAQGQAALEEQLLRLRRHVERELTRSGVNPDELTVRAILARTRVVPLDQRQMRSMARMFLTLRVLRDGSSALAALDTLERLFSGAGEHRASYDVAFLRRYLTERGFALNAPQSVTNAVDALERETARALRLQDVLQTPDGPVNLRRAVVDDVIAMAREGNVAVTGEAGGGKSVVLLQVASALLEQNERAIVIDLPGLGDPADLAMPLGIGRRIEEVLSRWGSDGRTGYLLLDGLDALRLQNTLPSLLRLIRALQIDGMRWHVIAASREFDLLSAPSVRTLFPRLSQQTSARRHPDPRLDNVAHVFVAGFDNAELDAIAAHSPTIRAILAAADDQLKELLRNPFNLAIAADIGIAEADFSNVRERIDLLHLWWSRRVSTGDRWAREDAIATVTRLMVEHRRLQVPVRDMSPPPQALMSLMSDNILNPRGRQDDEVAFRHALLFDYSAYRMLLRDTNDMLHVLGSDRDAFVFLFPSVIMRLAQVWRDDISAFYDLVARLFSGAGQRFALLVIVCRAIVRGMHSSADLLPLLTRPDIPARAVRYVVRALIRSRELGDPTVDRAREAWIDFTVAISEHLPEFEHDALLILTQFTEHDPNSRTDPRIVGAARRCLEYDLDSAELRQNMRNMALDAFLRTYDADPHGGRSLLERVFDPQRLATSGPYEFNTLGYHLNYVTDIDALSLAYDVIFSEITMPEGQIAMGAPSQIFGFVEDARQPLRTARWALAELYPRIVDSSPVAAVHALSQVLKLRQRQFARNESLVTYNIDGAVRSFTTDFEEDAEDEMRRIHDWARMKHAFEERLGSALTDGDRSYADAILEEARVASPPLSLLRMLLRNAGGNASMAQALVDIVADEATLTGHLLADDAQIFLERSFAALTVDSRLQIERMLKAMLEVEASDDRGEWLQRRLDLFLEAIPAGALTDRALIARKTELQITPATSEEERALNLRGFHMGQPTFRALRLSESAREHGADEQTIAAIDAAAELMPTSQGQAPPNPDMLAPMVRTLQPLLESAEGLVRQDLLDVTVAVVHYALTNQLLSPEEAREFAEVALAAADGVHPEQKPTRPDDESAGTSWGWPSARILAAQSLPMLYRMTRNPLLLEALERLSSDPVASVRARAIEGALQISHIDPERSWLLVERGSHDEVLGIRRAAAVIGSRLAPIAPSRYRALELSMYDSILATFPQSEFAQELQRNILIRALEGDVDAQARVTWLRQSPWRDVDLASKAAISLANMLRYNDPAARQAARDMLIELVQAIRARLEDFGDVAGLSGLDRYAIPRLREADQAEAMGLARLVVRLAERVYFDSGAYGASEGRFGGGDQTNSFASGDFLLIEPLIRLLSPIPYRTLSYHLVRTLKAAIDLEPSVVLQLGAIALRAGIADGLATEYMAQSEAATFIRSFIEHHRALLATDRDSLAAIMDTIDAFADAGWPEWIDVVFAIDRLYRED